MDFEKINNESEANILLALKALAKHERAVQAKFLAYLSLCDEKRLYLPEYRTMFDFVRKELGYSDSSALKRIQVARLARRFPEILVWIERGEITLTNLNLLAPHAKEIEFLASAKGKGRQEVEALLCTVQSRSEPRDRIAPIKVKLAPTVLFTETNPEGNGLKTKNIPTPPQVERVSIQFSASVEFQRKLERAQEVLRAKFPDGRMEHILEEALDLLLEKKDPDKKAERATKKVAPKKTGVTKNATNKSRYIPAATKHSVRRRDKDGCQFVLPNGKRCLTRDGLEFDHIEPFALGGSHSPANVRLVCRQHNQYRGRATFGPRLE